MMPENNFTINPIGVIRSELVDLDAAPRQGYEGALEAWLELNDDVAQAIEGLVVGDALMLLTWFHLARREILQVHPRSDPNNPLTGVFATRSPDRPNPIGLHRVTLLEIAGTRLRVAPLEAIDGTPLVDIKIAFAPSDG
jgi:tRNA-Thr(GGU) m(6)t(6)A37 methyltransferase TsaA